VVVNQRGLPGSKLTGVGGTIDGFDSSHLPPEVLEIAYVTKVDLWHYSAPLVLKSARGKGQLIRYSELIVRNNRPRCREVLRAEQGARGGRLGLGAGEKGSVDGD
jgi:hypothetical protein